MPTPPEDRRPDRPDGSDSGFSSAHELRGLDRQSAPRLRRRPLGLRGVALGAALASIAAYAALHSEKGGGEKLNPAWTVSTTEPNLPANGSNDDTEHVRTQLEGSSTVPSAVATFELGTTADGEGVLAARNPVVLEGEDRMVLGVTTANGPQSFVLDSEHYAINVLNGDNTGPVATSYPEAKQIVEQNIKPTTIDTVGLGGTTSSTTGTVYSPDLKEVRVGALIRFAKGPDGQLIATQG